MTKKAAI